MIFTPQVRLKIGDRDLTPVPPQYLQEFTFISRMAGYYEIEASIFEPWSFHRDPDYTALDDTLLGAEVQPNGTVTVQSQNIEFQFGIYMPETKESRWSDPLQTALLRLNPSMGEAGIEYHFTGIASMMGALGAAGTGVGLTFQGKRSDVFLQIAERYGWTPICEETDDTPFEVLPDGTSSGKTREWSTGNQSVMQFIRDKLIPGATSKATGQTRYQCQVRPNNVVVFAVPGSEVWGRTRVPAYTYFGGKSDSVVAFSPQFKSDQLGAWGAGGYLKRQYNPKKKRFDHLLINHRTVGEILGLGPATHLATRSLQAAQVMEVGTSAEDKIEEMRSVRNWLDLFKTVHEANITLLGSPATVDLRGGDIISVTVRLPSGRDHWSSGYWIVNEARHTVAAQGTYQVTCELSRDFCLLGNVQNENWVSDQQTLRERIESTPQYGYDTDTELA